MTDDPIVSEVRKARREILESYNGDFHLMMKDMIIKQRKSGHKVVTLKKQDQIQGVERNAYPIHR